MKKFRTYSAEQTVEIGLKLGETLKQRDIVCLTGDLGAGKTAFTSGIAAALGVKSHITSPTFTIVNEYSGTIPLYHFDVYRISDPGEMFEIGFEEYIFGNGVVVIEWADLIEELLPDEYIEVEIKKDISVDENLRIITIDFKGEKYRENECLIMEGV